MTAPKQEAKKIIDSLPEDTSYDEILKELAFDRMIQRGLKRLSRKIKLFQIKRWKIELNNGKILNWTDEAELWLKRYIWLYSLR